MKIVGTKPVQNLKRMGSCLHASDHFGLEANFEILRDDLEQVETYLKLQMKDELAQTFPSREAVNQMRVYKTKVDQFKSKMSQFEHFDYFGR